MPRIGVSGATGLIGGLLTEALRSDGVEVTTLGRSASSDVRWDFSTDVRGSALASRLENLDGFVHLVGAPIAKRWTRSRREAIVSSRVDTTRALSQLLASLRSPPQVLVSGSAVGVYGDRGDEVLSERSAPGVGFLAETGVAWEAATDEASQAGIRVVHARTGIVLTRQGGVIQKLLLPFQLGLGGRLGNGKQWMGWIGIEDAIGGIRFLLERPISGAVNLVSPNPTTNAEFTRALGRVLSRPTLAIVPAFALKAVFGEMAEATLLASQRAVPERLLEAGYVFRLPALGDALESAVRFTRNATD